MIAPANGEPDTVQANLPKTDYLKKIILGGPEQKGKYGGSAGTQAMAGHHQIVVRILRQSQAQQVHPFRPSFRSTDTAGPVRSFCTGTTARSISRCSGAGLICTSCNGTGTAGTY